jgi:hypothetical protein
MLRKSDRQYLSKFTVSAMIAGLFFFASIPNIFAVTTIKCDEHGCYKCDEHGCYKQPCEVHRPEKVDRKACNKNIQSMRECLGKVLCTSSSDREIRNALAPTLATNKAAASAASAMGLVFGISKAQSSAD